MAGERDDSRNVALEDTAVSSETVASESAPLAGGAGRELPVVANERYSIGAEVGRGGLGRVLRARDEILDRPVALKQLFATDDSSRRRFVREALITARLQHPSIVPVYEAGRREDLSPFYAMKLVAGRPLDQAIASTRTFTERLALLPTVLAVADAIAYAHSERIIHRDLKPGNVLVGSFGETVVIDWGLAKDLSIDDRDALEAGPYRGGAIDKTVAGSVLGTPGYMSPEQAAGGDVDERTDVYAIGAILYHVVSGAMPHRGTTLEEVIERVIKGDVKPLHEIAPQTPRDLAAIIAKAMAKRPSDRYRTAGELADDLRRFQTGQLVGAHHYTRAQRIARWVKRHRAISAVTAIATLVLVVGGLLSMRQILAEMRRADEERDHAMLQRNVAMESANRAILNQARALRDRDPALALAWLARMSVGGSGWDAARVIAADALAQPQLVRTLPGWNAAPKVTLDGRYAAAFGSKGIWIAELETGRVTTVAHKSDSFEGLELELCDDNKRAFAFHDGSIRKTSFAIDLVAGTATPTHNVKARDWARSVEACKSDRALFASDAGLVWRDPASGAERTLSTTPTDAAWLAPDRAHVVALERTGKLRRFELATGKPLGELAGPELATRAGRGVDGWLTSTTHAAMSANGSVGILVHPGISPLYWSFDGSVADAPFGDTLTGTAVTPDGSIAYAAWADGGKAVGSAEPEMPEVPRGTLAMSPTGAWLAGVVDGTLTIVDASRSPRPLHLDRIAGIAFLPDGKLLTIGESAARLWELPDPARSHGHVASAAAVSPSARWIAIDGNGILVRRDPAGASIERTEHARARAQTFLAVADSGEIVVTIDADVFRWPRGGALTKLGTHEGASSASAAILPDGTIITLGHASVAVWGAAGARYIALPHQGRVPPTAPFDVDTSGTRAFVTCSPKGEIRRACVVDLTTGKAAVLEGSNTGGAMSANGRVAITPAGDHYFLWDLDTRTIRADMPKPLQGIGITADGARAIVSGPRGVDLLDTASGKTQPLRTSGRPRGTMQISADGTTMIDNTLTIFDVASGEHRTLPYEAVAKRMRDGEVVVVTRHAIVVVPDDLPRDPKELKAKIETLPYGLDDHDVLVIEPR